MGACYSYRQFCSLGPLPPRTPARADAQVPRDAALGPCRHGKIGSFYFYQPGSRDDPAFGFFDIEVSVQKLSSSRLRLELYCIADGYQSFGGVSAGHPLQIALMCGSDPVACVSWKFPDVIRGHADPMSFAADLDTEADAFERIDRVDLLDVEGFSAISE